MEKYIERTVAKFGRLDISVQNAGITHAPAAIAEMDTATFDRVMQVNVRGRKLGHSENLRNHEKLTMAHSFSRHQALYKSHAGVAYPREELLNRSDWISARPRWYGSSLTLKLP